MGAKFDALSPRHQAAVYGLLQSNGNRTQALVKAGLTDQHADARITQVVASEIFSRPDVRAAIDEMLEENIGSAVESIERMTRWSRATIEDVTDEDGNLDMEKARATGAVVAIRSITYREWYDKSKQALVRERRVELHDAKDAEKVLMKYRGLLVDRVKVDVLPDDNDELTKALKAEVERTTGRRVKPAKEAN